MSPSKAVLPLCRVNFTLQSNLKHFTTVSSINIKDDCCSELKQSRKEWQRYRVCTNINNEESTEGETGRVYYQCVEKRNLPIEVYDEVSALFRYNLLK